MRNTLKTNPIWLSYVVILSFLFFAINGYSQVRKTFEQRSSNQIAPEHLRHLKANTNGKVYNLRGDFVMMGNSNLTLSTYYTDPASGTAGTTNDRSSNHNSMRYVNVDLNNTLNSSSAELVLPPDCTDIVYAGLYWSGRSQNNSNTGDFVIVNNSGTPTTKSAENLTHSTSTALINKVQIVREGSSAPYIVRYNITFDDGTTTFFRYNIDGNTRTVEHSTNGVVWTNVNGIVDNPGSSDNYNERFTFTKPIIIAGATKNYIINYLNRDERTNRTEAEYQGNLNYVNVIVPSTNVNILNKRAIRFKKEGQNNYDKFVANEEDLYYPSVGSNTDGYMFSSYVDVTSYVRQHKGGNYIAADLALRTGSISNDNTGLYGSWGLVVVYANTAGKWRDIQVYDGHAYVSGTTDGYNIDISGFKAAQNGDVRITLGVMAGEGDKSIPGDYLKIVKSAVMPTGTPSNTFNINNNNWVSLSHTGNSTNNFFNSSVYTQSVINTSVTTPRSPSVVNNTGIDISKFDVTNSRLSPSNRHEIIDNNQERTIIRYGTTGDTFVIYSLVLAVDAYVPDAEGVNLPSSIFIPANGSTAAQTLTNATDISNRMNNLQPGDEVSMNMSVYNYGNERILNSNIAINIPNSMSLISAKMTAGTGSSHINSGSVNFQQPVWISPYNSPSLDLQGVAPNGISTPASYDGGVINWNLNTIPTQLLPTTNPVAAKLPLSTLSYKLKVTNDCNKLRSSNNECLLLPVISGKITGIGENSGTSLKPEFIIGYNSGACENRPVYGDTKFTINPSSEFLIACSEQLPLDDGYVVFKKFCQVSNNEILRSEVMTTTTTDPVTNVTTTRQNYPMGTKFYSMEPTVSNPIEVTGNFPLNTNGSLTYYYAVTPGSNLACYLKLATQLDVITQEPTISNIDVCFGTAYSLNPTATGQDPTASFYYFENGSTTQLAVAPQPNKPGVYTYQVALGKVQGSSSCFGPKSTFTITLRGCNTPVNPMIYTPLNR